MEYTIIGLILLGYAMYLLMQKLCNWLKAQRKEARFRSIKGKILSATGSEHIAQTMMWLKDDLQIDSEYLDDRSLEKYQNICREPELAVRAFSIALTSPDVEMIHVGIQGFMWLNSIEGIGPLLDYYIDPGTKSIRVEAANVLIKLARMAPVQGEDGFLDIFNNILRTRSPGKMDKKLGILTSLLRQAADDVSKFSDDDFNYLIAATSGFADKLIHSRNTRFRYAGEDFNHDIDNARSLRESNITKRYAKQY